MCVCVCVGDVCSGSAGVRQLSADVCGAGCRVPCRPAGPLRRPPTTLSNNNLWTDPRTARQLVAAYHSAGLMVVASSCDSSASLVSGCDGERPSRPPGVTSRRSSIAV